jgi:hypothetical protein
VRVTDTAGGSLSLEIDTVNSRIKITTVDEKGVKESKTTNSIMFQQTRSTPCQINYTDAKGGKICNINPRDKETIETFFETQKSLGHLTASLTRGSGVCYTVTSNTQHRSKQGLDVRVFDEYFFSLAGFAI